MNKADEEILKILKEVFQLRRVNPIKSDNNMRLWIIRATFFVSTIESIGSDSIINSDNQ